MKGFLLIAFMGICFLAPAQEIGVKGGINLANMRPMDDGYSSGDMVVDFHIGGYAEFQLSEVVSFQPELLYSREGSAENDFFDQRLRLQLNFVQIPILFKFHVSDEVNLHIGPQTGFLVAQKFKSDGNTAKIEEDVFSTVVLSAAGGAGFDINENMEAGGRYVLGLTNWRTDVSDDVGGPRETGHVIQFYFSYKLR